MWSKNPQIDEENLCRVRVPRGTQSCIPLNMVWEFLNIGFELVAFGWMTVALYQEMLKKNSPKRRREATKMLGGRHDLINRQQHDLPSLAVGNISQLQEAYLTPQLKPVITLIHPEKLDQTLSEEKAISQYWTRLIIRISHTCNEELHPWPRALDIACAASPTKTAFPFASKKRLHLTYEWRIIETMIYYSFTKKHKGKTKTHPP